MPISTRDLSQMPSLDSLEKLCQSIAILDAILSPQWDYRYFSFNAGWDASINERMASMRNGSGDEYCLVFNSKGAILKGFDHEASMSPWARDPVGVWPGVLDYVPETFAPFLSEPAFSMGDCTFCIWREHGDKHWRRGPVAFPPGDDPDGSEGLLWMFDRRPETYVDFASEYYEKTLEVDLIRRIYAHETLSLLLVTGLNAEASWEEIVNDAKEIRYPIQA
jgi:hypothetical protein